MSAPAKVLLGYRLWAHTDDDTHYVHASGRGFSISTEKAPLTSRRWARLCLARIRQSWKAKADGIGLVRVVRRADALDEWIGRAVTVAQDRSTASWHTAEPVMAISLFQYVVRVRGAEYVEHDAVGLRREVRRWLRKNPHEDTPQWCRRAVTIAAVPGQPRVCAVFVFGVRVHGAPGMTPETARIRASIYRVEATNGLRRYIGKDPIPVVKT